MSKPWGGIGAWADEAERDDEERAAAAASAPVADPQSFPSLKEAGSKKPKKKKMTLSEFGAFSQSGVGSARGLTRDEIIQLPTCPRQRTPEEMQQGRLGGGFSSYDRSGGVSGRPMRDRDGVDGSWGGGSNGGGRRSYGGFEDERRGPSSRASDFDQTSRADESDNWGTGKKTMPSFDQGRQSRYGGLGEGNGGGFSRANEFDNWTAGKKPAPTRSSTFGTGFRDSNTETDRWSRGGAPNAGNGDGFRQERPRLVLDPPKAGNMGASESLPVVKTNKPNPFAAARPREEVLAEKGLDWKKLDLDMDAKKESSQSSRPPSAQSSRPSSAQSNRSESQGLLSVDNVAKPRPKVNPFGDAKPREVLLQERGQDWRKIDLEMEHRSVGRPETAEEMMLKEEIDHLKKELAKESSNSNKEPQQESGTDHQSLQGVILEKERDLEKLIRDLDDKVRFGQKAVERPGSGAGRINANSDRDSHSQSGSVDEYRTVESMDRPRSRGGHDAWSRPVDDRRNNFHGSRERGFFSNRNLDRSASRERW